MTQEYPKELYIMDIKTLLTTKVTIDEVDECKFALFIFDERKCDYNLRGANIQTLSHSLGYTNPQYIVSKDIGSLMWLKESFKWLIQDIGFKLNDAWKHIYDENFINYKKIK
jgi:hypothetical protein